MERLSAERGAALALVATQAHDVDSLTAEIDEQAAALQELVGQQAQALAAAQATAQEATARADRQAQDLTGARAEMERITAAAALADRESTIEHQTMQVALERQIDRYTELKAMVDHLKPLANIGAAQPQAENSGG